MWTFKCQPAHFKMLYQFAKLPSRKLEPIYIPFKYKCTYYLKPSSTLVIIILFKIFQFHRLKSIFSFVLIVISFITSEVKYLLCLLAICISLFYVTCLIMFQLYFSNVFFKSFYWFLRVLYNSEILTLCCHVCCEFLSQLFITLTM